MKCCGCCCCISRRVNAPTKSIDFSFPKRCIDTSTTRGDGLNTVQFQLQVQIKLKRKSFDTRVVGLDLFAFIEFRKRLDRAYIYCWNVYLASANIFRTETLEKFRETILFESSTLFDSQTVNANRISLSSSLSLSLWLSRTSSIPVYIFV